MKVPAALKKPLVQAPLLGAVATLGFAPFFLWPLLVASVAVLYRLIENASPRRAALLGLLWGFAHNLTALYWLPRAFYLDADRSVKAAIFGGIPALLGIAFVSALFMVAIAYLTRRAPQGLRPFVFAGAWMAIEIARSLTTLGFPWLPLGASWAGSLPLMQSAALWGVHGLSLLLLAGAMLVAYPTAKRMRFAVSLLLVLYAGGIVRLHGAPQPEAGCTEQTATCVRMVQPNVQSAHKWDPVIRWSYLNDTIALAAAPSATTPHLVVMPETAVAFYLEETPEAQAALARLLQPGQTLLTGTVQRRPGQFFNGFVSVDKQDDNLNLLGWYNKRLLVPFGEYIPFRPLIEALPLPGPVRTLSQNRLDYSPGTYPPTLPTHHGGAVPLICYEGIFPYHVAAAAPGARMLANITNDNWFTGTTALAQHAALERLRAVETGLPLVRVANTGITFMATPYGQISTRLPTNIAMVADVPLPEALPATPFLKLVGAFSNL